MANSASSLRQVLSEVRGLLVRDAGGGDDVQGVAASVIAEPESVAQVSSLLRVAFREGLSVVPRGSGSKLDWTDPPRCLDIVLDLAGLRGVVDHAAGDMVVVARAGTRLADLQSALASHRQWLALDPPGESTLGGLVATNAAGPRQLVYGRPRDVLIGVEVVLADGTIARSGGRVVKNVAGYDLGKLYSGSLGTLGVIVECTFRLHPISPASETLEFEVPSEVEAQRAAAALARSQLEASFATVRWSPSEPVMLAVGLSGTPSGVRERGGGLVALMASVAAIRRAADFKRRESVGGCGLRIGFRPADMARVLGELRAAAATAGTKCSAECQALSGVADVRLAGSAEAAARVVEGLRRRLGADANVLIRTGPPELKRSLGSLGRPGAPVSLLARVKREFDPTGVLSPGRVPWA